MAANQQAPDGKVSYIRSPDGTLRRAKKGETDASRVEAGTPYVSARLEDGTLTLRVGATATIGGERLVHVAYDLEDKALTDAVLAALSEVIDTAGDVAVRDAMKDAQRTVELEAEDARDEEDR